MSERASNKVRFVTDRLLDEGIVSVTQAAEAVGIRISTKTALRWCLAGVRGIRLESIKVGGKRMSSAPAMRRFIAATQQSDPERSSVLDREAADAVLAAFGLGRHGGDHRG